MVSEVILFFEIMIIFVGTFMIERYVLLVPEMESGRQRMLYVVSSVFVIVTFFIAKDAAQYMIIFFGALNIYLSRKNKKLLGLFMVIPVIGIMNGVASPFLLVPLMLRSVIGYTDLAGQIIIMVIYVIIFALLIVFYFKGSNWRKWFNDNMKNRSLDVSENVIIFISGIFMMFFSNILNLDIIKSDMTKGIIWMCSAYYVVTFILTVTIITMVFQGNIRKFYHDQVENMQFGIIFTMADLVESRDDNTGGHISRTKKYVEIIGRNLRKAGMYPEILTEQYLRDMIIAAPLHDIGKIHIPDAILNKPGRLTDEEFDIMKTHTTAGAEILEKAKSQLGEFGYLNIAIDMARYHHEWFNGKGYPAGIGAEDIPLCARIMAVADVFDALVSKRCYKDAMPVEKAYSIISDESGTHFDSVVVEAFLSAKKDTNGLPGL